MGRRVRFHLEDGMIVYDDSPEAVERRKEQKVTLFRDVTAEICRWCNKVFFSNVEYKRHWWENHSGDGGNSQADYEDDAGEPNNARLKNSTSSDSGSKVSGGSSWQATSNPVSGAKRCFENCISEDKEGVKPRKLIKTEPVDYKGDKSVSWAEIVKGKGLLQRCKAEETISLNEFHHEENNGSWALIDSFSSGCKLGVPVKVEVQSDDERDTSEDFMCFSPDSGFETSGSHHSVNGSTEKARFVFDSCSDEQEPRTLRERLCGSNEEQQLESSEDWELQCGETEQLESCPILPIASEEDHVDKLTMPTLEMQLNCPSKVSELSNSANVTDTESEYCDSESESVTFDEEIEEPPRRHHWCKLCDTYYPELSILKLHIEWDHTRDASTVNLHNQATWDLEIARTPYIYLKPETHSDNSTA